MAESLETPDRAVKRVKTISSEVDETEYKFHYTNQRIKVEVYLTNKLNMRAKRYKERCSFICEANSKLQIEITQAQEEITSLLAAENTMKSANVELEKELFTTRNRKEIFIEKLKNREEKYNKVWIESKARYESLPYVQKLLKAKEELVNIDKQIEKLEAEEDKLIEEIRAKKESCRDTDRKRVVKLAEFMLHQRPKLIDEIQQKTAAVKELENELKSKDDNSGPLVEKYDSKIGSHTLNPLTIPNLQLNYSDYDLESLDEIKTGVDDLSVTSGNTPSISLVVINPVQVSNKKQPDTDSYILQSSLFMHKRSVSYETQNYAKTKLINILEDIKIQRKDIRKMLEDVNPEALQTVYTISADDRQNHETQKGILNNKDNYGLEDEDMEVLDLTTMSAQNIVKPPTQFMDLTQPQKGHELQAQDMTTKETISRDEPLNKKRVTFDLSTQEGATTVHEVEELATSDDDGFAKMKDMIMKEHNLDCSPQFVYTKNTITPLNLQIQKPDAVVTSKFFPQEQYEKTDKNESEVVNEDGENMEVKAAELTIEDNNEIMDVDDVDNNTQTLKEVEPKKPTIGFITLASTPVLPEFSDDTINTTGFLEGDGDFEHNLDASLLLSPKANYSMPDEKNQQALSQDVPNFFSGFRKTDLSFFGRLGSSDPKPDSSIQNQGTSGFTFNFSGEEKKGQRGPFSMFQ